MYSGKATTILRSAESLQKISGQSWLNKERWSQNTKIRKKEKTFKTILGTKIFIAY